MRYEIREMTRSGKVKTYKTDAIEIKTDNHGCYIEGVGSIGQMVGYKPEGKSRRTWISTAFARVEIIDNLSKTTTILKSCRELLEDMGRHDIIEKWFA